MLFFEFHLIECGGRTMQLSIQYIDEIIEGDKGLSPQDFLDGTSMSVVIMEYSVSDPLE